MKMKKCISISLMTIAVLVVYTTPCLAQYPTEVSTQKIVNIEAKNMPLVEVLRIIFDNTKLSYTLDQGLEALSVTATLKNTPFEVALRSVTSTAGLVYRIRDGVYLISSKPQVEVPSSKYGFADTPTVSDTNRSGRAAEVIDLKYLNAGDITRFITGRSSVPLSVTATSGNKLILYGSMEDLDAAKKFVSALDVESALPRPVRLKLLAKVTVSTAKGPKVYSASAESVGAEQTKIMIMQQNMALSSAKEANACKQSAIYASITPLIDSDGTIGLSGGGSFLFPFGAETVNTLTRSFNITASVMPGKPYIIAAGSVNLDTGKADFELSVVVTIEKGRVYVTPQQEQSSSQNSTPNFGIDPNNPSRTW